MGCDCVLWDITSWWYMKCKTTSNPHLSLKTRAEPTLYFAFFPTYFSFQQFFFSYLFCSIFCSLSSYFSTHKRLFLVYLQLLSIHDCCIRVIHNTVTVLLEHLDLLAVFPEAYVDLILFVTILVEYFLLCNAK